MGGLGGGGGLGFPLGGSFSSTGGDVQFGNSGIYPTFDGGTDTRCTTDLGLTDVQISGGEVLVNALVRRLTTPKGALQFVGDDPNYGFDVRQLVNENLTGGAVAAYSSIIRSQILHDPRVADATVSLSYDRQTEVMAIFISHTLSTGQTFKWMLGVNGLTGATYFSVQ